MCYRAIRRHATALNIVAVNAWRRLSRQISQVGPITTIEIDVFEVKSMNMAGEIAVRARSPLSKNTKDFGNFGRVKKMNNAPLTPEL